MTDDLNYEEDLRIDPENLDVEWLEQPHVFMKYAEECAHADAEAKRKEEKVKIVRSELVLEINEEPELLGEDVKPTKDNVEAYVRTNKKHKMAKKEYIEAQHRADVLRTTISAFHQRKLALENLVRLQAQGYVAGPTEPRDLGIEYGKNAKHRRASERIKKTTKRSRRTR